MLIRLVAVALAGLVLVTAAAVPAAEAQRPDPRPMPFGHDCRRFEEVRFCPTGGLGERVASFDRVPLDVDVTLPSRGAGPFPTIVMLHEFGGTKDRFVPETPEDIDRRGGPRARHLYDPIFYARRGYAVVTYSARGFGRSCGKPSSRTPDCSAGWQHFGDQRYEARDTQHLLGLLVDDGIAHPDALGVTGQSYGGVQAMELALLRDRIRLADGAFQPWTSPSGRPLRIAAAWSRYGYSDPTDVLLPNGRFLDFRPERRRASRSPLGFPIDPLTQSFLTISRTGFTSPAGADASADIENWVPRFLAGDPFGSDVRSIAAELSTFHGASGLSGPTAPLLLESGFTDGIIPIRQSLTLYNRLRRADRTAPVWLQFGDVGHAPADPESFARSAFAERGAAFMDAMLLRSRPAPGRVAAHLLSCPRRKTPVPAIIASSWERIHRGAVVLESGRTQRISAPARRRVANPGPGRAGPGGCDLRTPGRVRRGTAAYSWKIQPFTLLGRPTIRARVSGDTNGRRLVAVLYDIARNGKVRQLTQGVYRLGRERTLLFQLDGSGYRLRRGHRIALTVAGFAPGLVSPSNRRLRMRIEELTLELPARERPDGDAIVRPRLARR